MGMAHGSVNMNDAFSAEVEWVLISDMVGEQTVNKICRFLAERNISKNICWSQSWMAYPHNRSCRLLMLWS